MDLSYPHDHSINDGIPSELASVSYTSVNDAVQLVLQLGKGSELVKLDLKQAYLQISIHPQDHHLFEMSWEGKVFVDRALPFGLRSAPKIFTAASDVIAWAFHMRGIQSQIQCLDEFLFMAPPRPGLAQEYLDRALAILDYLGFPVSWNKIEGPSTRITFLGIRLPLSYSYQIQNWLG